MPKLLSATTARALGSPVETTLDQLLQEYGLELDQQLLSSLGTLQECLEEYSLTCAPPIGQGGLSDPRVISNSSAVSLTSVREEVARLESATVEFKSSLEVDRQRLVHDPGRPASEYRSEAVLGATLKTVAAFANSGGGTLFLGVEDNGNFCGLEEDFAAVSYRANYDGWDLYLRSVIRSRFSDGAALNAYVKTQLYHIDGRSFVRAGVAPRRRLTFLKQQDGSWGLFVRAGTQTNSIPYCEIEQHFSLKPLY